MKPAGWVWLLLVVALAVAMVASTMTADAATGVTVVLGRVTGNAATWFLGAACGVALAHRTSTPALLIATLGLSVLVLAVGLVGAFG